MTWCPTRISTLVIARNDYVVHQFLCNEIIVYGTTHTIYGSTKSLSALGSITDLTSSDVMEANNMGQLVILRVPRLWRLTRLLCTAATALNQWCYYWSIYQVLQYHLANFVCSNYLFPNPASVSTGFTTMQYIINKTRIKIETYSNPIICSNPWKKN